MSVHDSLRKISESKWSVEGDAHKKYDGLVSVCIPNFNKAIYLEECLESVAAQSYKDFEIVFVDDCSRDNSWSIAHNFRRKNPHLSMRMLQLPIRRGTAWTQNIAYYLGQGEFIMNMDSDDVIHPQKIEKQVYALKNDDVDVVGTNFKIFKKDINNPLTNDGGVWLKYDTEEIQDSYLFNRIHCVCFGTLMYKAKVIEHIAGMTKEFIGTEDYEIVFRLIQKGFRVGNLKEALYYYRSNETQRSKLFHSS